MAGEKVSKKSLLSLNLVSPRRDEQASGALVPLPTHQEEPMNTFSKFAAITFTVLALGASAQAQSQGGGRGGGEGVGGGEPAGVMLAANGPISLVVAPERRKRANQNVRSIPIYNCGEGISIYSGNLCQPVLR